MRILFAGGGTGGHLYPGLAIARALVAQRPDLRPHFVGARRGIEREVLPTTEFPHTLLDLHPVYRPQLWRNWRTVRGAWSSWRGVSALAREERPALVVGTGGYASAAALAWGVRHGVPVVQHIGDAVPGHAARLFARWSTECYLGFADAVRSLPGPASRYHVTGNPIQPPPSPRPDAAAARREWGLAPDATVLLIFGGSQGSLALNTVVGAWVATGLPPGVSLLWATGRATYDRFAALASPTVRIVPYLAPIAAAYAAADLALVRGGMMGTAELCAWGLPMIIVPLPSAAADHQTKNAEALARACAAIHLPQRGLTAAQVATVVEGLVQDPARRAALTRGALALAKPNAAAEIASRIVSLLPATR